ncbi:MAG: ABC transporter ATP-binding protein, partial [Anaerolineae bacterium]
MIDLQHVTYTFADGRQPALKDVTWQAAAGEFVLVTGASGSGKSTLLRLLNGLVPHFTGGRLVGRVQVNGQDVVAVGPAAMSRSVGFVRQTPEAQSVLDRVAAEVAFGLENQAVPPAEMRVRVGEALALLGLTALRHRLIHELSGGEQQKVAIAAALALRPS